MWLCVHSLAFCRLIGYLAWVLRSFETLVLGLATAFCNFSVSRPQTLFFWHVNSITKEHIFMLTMHLSIYIFKFLILYMANAQYDLITHLMRRLSVRPVSNRNTTRSVHFDR